MKLYTCCPHEGCGAFQGALTWLKSYGIEPSLGVDENHYFEFEIPDDWPLEQKIEFRWQLSLRTFGAVFCCCGKWLDENLDDDLYVTTCEQCGTQYRFCTVCVHEAVERWGGCTYCEDASPEQGTEKCATSKN